MSGETAKIRARLFLYGHRRTGDLVNGRRLFGRYIAPFVCPVCGGEHMSWVAVGACVEQERQREPKCPMYPEPGRCGHRRRAEA